MEQILIVDDEEPVRLLLGRILERFGYQCTLAANAHEGRNHLEERRFDMVLSDLRMPGESGLDFLRYVLSRWPDTAAIIVSVMDNPDIAQEALEMGVYGYILKPFNVDGVRISVANALWRRKLEMENRAHRENLEQLVERRTLALMKTIHQLEFAQKGLSQSEAKFRTLVHNVPAIVYNRYRGGGFEVLNSKLESWLGYSTADLGSNGEHWYDLISPDSGEAVRKAHENAFQSRRSYMLEYRVRSRAGEFLWLQDIGQMLKGDLDEGGHGSVYVSGVLLDITERRNAEEELKRTHREMEQLVSSIGSVLIGVNEQGRVMRWNWVAEEVFGVSAPGILGRSLERCVIDWEWDKVSEGILACREKGRPVGVDDVRYTRANGKHGFLSLSFNPVTNRDEQRVGILILGTDITDRRVLESQLTHAQKLESIGQLAAGIAHEINTPIQYVGANARFLQGAFKELMGLLLKYEELVGACREKNVPDGMIPEVETLAREIDLEYLTREIPRCIAESLEGVDRVAGIVLAMKDFSHPGSEEKVFTDINRSVESTLTVARNEWKYACDVVMDLDASLPLAPCFPGEFNQVVLNVLINAVHAVEDRLTGQPGGKGSITVRTRKVDSWCEVQIADTGTGIPEAIRNKVFDPFFTTKEVGRGTGQGLALSHAVIVEKHHGTLTFETEPGVGTTFFIRIPLDDGAR